MKKSRVKELKEDRKPNDAPLFVIGSQIYSYNGIARPRCMPLNIENNLPLFNIRLWKHPKSLRN